MAAGRVFAGHARDVLDAAQWFNDWLHTGGNHDVSEMRVGASMTIAENLLPA